MALNATTLAAERKAAIAAVAPAPDGATPAQIQTYIDACMLADSTAIVDHLTANAEVIGDVDAGIDVLVNTSNGIGETTQKGKILSGVIA